MGNESGFNMADGATNEAGDTYDPYNQLLAGSILGFGDEDYQRIKAWDRMGGMMKIEPITKKQNFQYTTVAYIAEGLPKPQIQRVPISDPKITPHQISFDFFDTTEGKIGVSNATEKHMVLECDILVSDIIYFYWNHNGSENQGQLFGADGTGGGGAFSGMRFIQEEQQIVEDIVSGDCINNKEIHTYNKNGEGFMNWLVSSVNPWNRTVTDFQQTQAFINFRNTFLQQFSGWICKFTSEVFGVFDGVITDISYEIESGSMDAKWHIKIEEAIFTEDYSEEGKKPTETSEGSQTDSGDVQVSE